MIHNIIKDKLNFPKQELFSNVGMTLAGFLTNKTVLQHAYKIINGVIYTEKQFHGTHIFQVDKALPKKNKIKQKFY
jgi:hypothetical protein